MSKVCGWVGALWLSLGSSLVFAQTAEDYVSIKDGHLHRHGQRVRFWGVNMTTVRDRSAAPGTDSTSYPAIDAGVQRLKKLGFNAVRFWINDYKTFPEYKKGDKSRYDYNDYFLSKLSKEGFVVWLAGMNFHPKDMVTPEDVNVINDPATAEAWKAALGKDPSPVNSYEARAWDPRLRELGKRQLKKFLDHYNPYTGKHFYEDPVIAVWELSNEEWWIPKMMRNAGQGENNFFQQELYKQL